MCLYKLAFVIIHVLQRCVTCNQSKYIMRDHSDNFLSDFKGKNENSPCPVYVLIIL